MWVFIPLYHITALYGHFMRFQWGFIACRFRCIPGGCFHYSGGLFSAALPGYNSGSLYRVIISPPKSFKRRLKRFLCCCGINPHNHYKSPFKSLLNVLNRLHTSGSYTGRGFSVSGIIPGSRSGLAMIPAAAAACFIYLQVAYMPFIAF